MAKEKKFTASFKGFDYAISIPSATFEGASARTIRDRIQDHLNQWYGACYRQLIDKFQGEFEIEVSNGKKATLQASYANGYASLDGSILQQVNVPADDSKRIKFPIPGTDKFELIELVAKGVLFVGQELLQREIRDGWVKVSKELSSEEMIKSWEKNDIVVTTSTIRGGFSCEHLQRHACYPSDEKDITKKLANAKVTSLVLLELTEEGKVKFESAGFYKGPDTIKRIQKFVVDKQVPIDLTDRRGGGEWGSAIQRGLLEVTEELTLKELKARGLAIKEKQGGYWKIESGWRAYTDQDDKFVLLKLTPKGQIKYDEGIEKALVKEVLS